MNLPLGRQPTTSARPFIVELKRPNTRAPRLVKSRSTSLTREASVIRAVSSPFTRASDQIDVVVVAGQRFPSRVARLRPLEGLPRLRRLSDRLHRRRPADLERQTAGAIRLV